MNEDSALDASFKGDIPKFMDEEEDEDTVATILTLDRGTEDEEVANAPEYHGNKLQSLYELDNELAFTLPSDKRKKDRKLDLTILSSVLLPAEQILEEDVQWSQSTLTQLLNED
jgi:hypothetical protein